MRAVPLRAQPVEVLQRSYQRLRAPRLQEVRGELRDGKPLRPLRRLEQVVQGSARRDVCGEIGATLPVECLGQRLRGDLRPLASVEPRLGPLREPPPAILHLGRNPIERRAARRLLQRAKHLVQLANGRLWMPRRRAAERAVLPQGAEDSARRGAEAAQVGTRDGPAKSGQALRPDARSAPQAEVLRELARRSVAQQPLDPGVELAQGLQLLLAQGRGGGLGKRAAHVQRLRSRCFLRLAGEPRQRGAALFQEGREGMKRGGSPAGRREVSHLREQRADLARSVRQIGGCLLPLEPGKDPVHPRQVTSQLAGARIGQRPVTGGGEARQGFLVPLDHAETVVAAALDHGLQPGGARAGWAAGREQVGQRHCDGGERAERTRCGVRPRRAQILVPQVRLTLAGAISLLLQRANLAALVGMQTARIARLGEPRGRAIDGALAGRQESQELLPARS